MVELFQTDASVLDKLKPTIRPRSDWAEGLPPVGPLEVEDEVRFLLVHHTASPNTYSENEVVDQIRGFYRFHTGPTKGWPDVAYNFFVDRFGGIWEAREGSLTQPVRGDATGGSQGFAVLCSLIGDYTETPMSDAQQQSLTQLLAWLSELYGVDTKPGTQTNFISRGSNKWPEGSEVATATIAGHRDMSQTSCPGDAVYDVIQNQLPTEVTSVRQRTLDEFSPTTPETTQPEISKPTLQLDDRPILRSAPVAQPNSSTSLPLVAGAISAAVGIVGGLVAMRTRRNRNTDTGQQTDSDDAEDQKSG